MDSTTVVSLYNQGYSIDYIINQYYYSLKNENKIINTKLRRIILIENELSKNKIRGEVYKILYNENKK